MNGQHILDISNTRSSLCAWWRQSRHAESDGGDCFEREFPMLMECRLFENVEDGYVKPKIMDVPLWSKKNKIVRLVWAHDHCIAPCPWETVGNTTGEFTGLTVFLEGAPSGAVSYCWRKRKTEKGIDKQERKG